MHNLLRGTMFMALVGPVLAAACGGGGGQQTEEKAPEEVATHTEAVGVCTAECWCDEYGYCTFRIEDGPDSQGCGQAGLACCDAIDNCEDIPNECPWGDTCQVDWDCGFPWQWDCVGNCCVGWGS